MFETDVPANMAADEVVPDRVTLLPGADVDDPVSIASVVALLASTINTWQKHEFKRRRELSLTPSQAYVLYHVRVGFSTSTDIAKSLSVTRRAITTTVDQLVSKGLLVRKDDPVDRRVVRLLITDKGTAESLALENQLLEDLTACIAELSESDRQLIGHSLNILLPAVRQLSPPFIDQEH